MVEKSHLAWHGLGTARHGPCTPRTGTPRSGTLARQTGLGSPYFTEPAVMPSTMWRLNTT